MCRVHQTLAVARWGSDCRIRPGPSWRDGMTVAQHLGAGTPVRIKYPVPAGRLTAQGLAYRIEGDRPNPSAVPPGLGLWSLAFPAMNRWATLMLSLQDAGSPEFASSLPCRCATLLGDENGPGRAYFHDSIETRAQRAPLTGVNPRRRQRLLNSPPLPA